MRRGQINNKSLILIFIVALFTILSYASDQYVIRHEDKFRDLNIDYNNLRTKITSYTSISQSLEDIGIETDNTIENFLRKRHIWIKSLILISSDYKTINRKKNMKSFKDPSTAEYNIKINLINDFADILYQSFYIAEQLNAVYIWNYELFKKYFVIQDGETLYKGVGLDFADLDKIFKENVDEFHYKDIGLYQPFYYIDEFYYKDYKIEMLKVNQDALYEAMTRFSAIRLYEDKMRPRLVKFTLKNWLDLNRFTTLLIENLGNNIKLIDENTEYVDKLIEEDEKKLEDIFIDLKNVSFKKNYLILFSILSQVLSLLFLLLLFRSFLMIKRN